MTTDTTKSILLIEDDEALREMYTLIITKAGYILETATDGVQGIAKLRQGGYSLVLLDLMMPNLDGVGVLKSMQVVSNRPKKQNGPIIILSNAGYDKVAEEATKLGAKGFLMKAELTPKELIKEIQDRIG
jgi:DNA-binding response OmpR family regulator